MKEFIEEKMVSYFKICPVDKYGQVKVINPYEVFKDKTEEVFEYLKTDRIMSITTYGGQYGTYKGISPSYDILDRSLRQKCYTMLNDNKNYIWAMTH